MSAHFLETNPCQCGRNSEGIVASGMNKERLGSQLNGELKHFGVYSETYSTLCGKVMEGRREGRKGDSHRET